MLQAAETIPQYVSISTRDQRGPINQATNSRHPHYRCKVAPAMPEQAGDSGGTGGDRSMPANIFVFRDTLSVDPTTIASLNAAPQDTLVLAARKVSLSG